VKRRALLLTFAMLLAACAQLDRPENLTPEVSAALARAGEAKPPARPESLERALLPPVQLGMPRVPGLEAEPRFDLSVTNAPAGQVFMSIVAGTRYSMLLHADVTGAISVNLKDVTVEDALSAIRELYGYDYRIEGARIFVQGAGMQTRVFRVNYLPGQRRGLTEVRVQSSAVSETPTSQGSATQAPAPGTAGSRSLESSRVRTEQSSDFWLDLRAALSVIIGSADGRSITAEGRSIIVSPQAGVVVVRALPAELRAVENYLRETRLAVERQVMLEAKIVEVTLSSSFQAGINWAGFSSGGLSAGQVSQGTLLTPRDGGRLATGAGAITTLPIAGFPPSAVNPAFSAQAGRDLANHTIPGGSVFGLALQTANFAALLTFLETQGHVQVLSSPRLATMNNQKAVLKVGTDEFFVTGVSTTSTTTNGATTTTPTITVQPFFSGIVLDVTPQIDESGNIILHIHPAVSEVTESNRVVNLGGTVDEIRLPLARSTVNETDTIVRVVDGNIVAIGGLMSVDVRDSRGGLPGISEGGLGDLARNTDRRMSKRELVILLKPTVIQSERSWEAGLNETRERFEAMKPVGRDRR
jgi:MSHA biogenesis protein MshL